MKTQWEIITSDDESITTVIVAKMFSEIERKILGTWHYVIRLDNVN